MVCFDLEVVLLMFGYFHVLGFVFVNLTYFLYIFFEIAIINAIARSTRISPDYVRQAEAILANLSASTSHVQPDEYTYAAYVPFSWIVLISFYSAFRIKKYPNEKSK